MCVCVREMGDCYSCSLTKIENEPIIIDFVMSLSLIALKYLRPLTVSNVFRDRMKVVRVFRVDGPLMTIDLTKETKSEIGSAKDRVQPFAQETEVRSQFGVKNCGWVLNLP